MTTHQIGIVLFFAAGVAGGLAVWLVRGVR